MRIINKFLQETKQSYTIFCDLDGVLVNFEKAVYDLGYGTFEEIEKKYGESFIWTLIAKKGVSFWSNAEWQNGGQELWKYLKSYDPIILSSPTNAQSSHDGKKLWVKKNLGLNVKLILETKKEKYADPKAILIDDRDKNIKRWKDAGGMVIKHINTKTTISKLKGILE